MTLTSSWPVDLVVLAPLGVRRDLEPVDPERLDPEHPTHEADCTSRPGRLDLVDVDHRVAISARRSGICRSSHRIAKTPEAAAHAAGRDEGR
jgi:hypothetical protein